MAQIWGETAERVKGLNIQVRQLRPTLRGVWTIDQAHSKLVLNGNVGWATHMFGLACLRRCSFGLTLARQRDSDALLFI